MLFDFVPAKIHDKINEQTHLNKELVFEQIKLFVKGTNYVDLVSEAKIGNGIAKYSDDEIQKFISLFNNESKNYKITKFVPASGAATRMFKKLLSYYSSKRNESIDELMNSNDDEKITVGEFLANIKKFGFFETLSTLISDNGDDIHTLIKSGENRKILEYVLFQPGLNLSEKPKGVIEFHFDSGKSRTALEEQLLEAEHYSNNDGKPTIHLTISENHKNWFEEITNRYKNEINKNLDVSFSNQKPYTDTIAVDMENVPFIDDNGSLVFRPGGHGALLENLNSIDADIVFIKNIDNVFHPNFVDATIKYKKMLGGILLNKIKLIDKLHFELSDVNLDEEKFTEILNKIKSELNFKENTTFENLKLDDKILKIKNFLNRPVRIGGMVKNEGQPGGGPFWIKDKTGSVSLQIVESAQVNKSDENQNAIFQNSTHFSPVDFACYLKDNTKNKFNLLKYRDNETYFISEKSFLGRDLKALELPGLWNGGMADWITVFVEVPLETFSPVKEVNDLLNNSHQPK